MSNARTTSRTIQIAVRVPIDLHTAAAKVVKTTLAAWVIEAMRTALNPMVHPIAAPQQASAPPAKKRVIRATKRAETGHCPKCGWLLMAGKCSNRECK